MKKPNIVSKAINIWDSHQVGVLGWILLGCIAISLYFILSQPPIVEKLNTLTLETKDFQTTCDTDSMGLVLNCGDHVKSTKVEIEDKISLGRIYIYHYPNSSYISHRVGGCADYPKCQKLIFRGDNNKLIDNWQTTGYVDRQDVELWIADVIKPQ